MEYERLNGALTAADSTPNEEKDAAGGPTRGAAANAENVAPREAEFVPGLKADADPPPDLPAPVQVRKPFAPGVLVDLTAEDALEKIRKQISAFPPRYELEECDRQLILLAIAELALSRPGFEDTLRRIARIFFGTEIFEDFKRTNADRVRASHGPFGFAPTLPASNRDDVQDAAAGER